jgi:predicted phosphate transport protein (TIGR00153 family)
MLKKFLPKETDFFSMFEKAALNLNKSANLLLEMMEDLSASSDIKAKEIYEAEQEGDMLTHEVMRKLNKTFLTPVDREDIHSLVGCLDDVLDLIWASADRAVLFKLESAAPEAVELCSTLLETTEFITKAIGCLKDKKYSYIQEYCIEINRLENRGDRIFREALVKLFDNIKDPILVIKWKEVYEHLEDAEDTCEDVADILESIVLKHA